MCPSKIVSYLKVELSGDDVLLDAQPVHKELYPLAAVVDRGSEFQWNFAYILVGRIIRILSNWLGRKPGGMIVNADFG